MRKTLKANIASAVALTLALGAVPAFAGQAQAPPAQQPPARSAQPAPVQGDLVSVDSDAKSLTVKIADGSEVKFMYNDKTEVTGAKDGVAGLATLKEGKVTVHFMEDAQSKTRLATRIIVQPRQ